MTRNPLTLVPNIITIARIAAIVPISAFILAEDPILRAVALSLYVLAAASDWVDGYLARAWDQYSDLGRMLDPIADKILVIILITILAWDRSLSALDLFPAVAILFRETFIPGLREFLGNKTVVLPVTKLAKWKTTIQLVALGLVIAEGIMPVLGIVADIVLWIAGIITLWTGWDYLRASWPHLSGIGK
ncbi:CDP-diacylglycerol--glycerol-3-phosphate 3-phosphatidyltransferase [Devosia lucknowensis]|uniref:CDP-diacylglycerol--glycerol-3-phosphate 3-phosphatidyltransferase n=1 Tax=Devosia lucknowensis TaxID=1096929 RepID=A0A1Y6FCJ9_9HYPH|nr:CDP-diacylglycerol--glycerol-3-phosphate 3-phosphatidyltransferase [Devosia lucknowensis]SMQ71321.1 CDP-diacylglycerol--glycerol-3-phosphate 3-phosphatidyltransferase [Devosia lucknowensis]